MSAGADGCDFSLARKRAAAFNGDMFKCHPSIPGSASQQSRREFIRNLGSAVALGAAMSPFTGSLAAENGRAGTQKTLVGSNSYGWGQYAQRDKKKLDVEEVI